MRVRVVLLAVLVAVTSALATLPAQPAAASGPEIWFPVQVDENVHWTDSFGDRRSSGRTHKGVDIMAPQMQPVYAAHSGYIARAYGGDSRACLDGGACSSYGFLIYGDDGWSSFYLHLNNDTPGRPNGCDSRGGAEAAFSPRLVEVLRDRGTLEPLPRRWDPRDVVRVEQGELIGYLGSSGNAGCANDHLHFELWPGHEFKSADDPTKPNPTPYVNEAHAEDRYYGPGGAEAPAPATRLAGSNRVATSVALSQAAFDAAGTVVVAPAQVYPEALLAAPLAATMDAPVLLTWNEQTAEQDVLADEVATEIRRLGATDAVIVGATDRLDGALEQQLQDKAGIAAERIRRIAEPDRYALSRTIAEQVLTYHGWAPVRSTSAHATGDDGSGSGDEYDLQTLFDDGSSAGSDGSSTEPSAGSEEAPTEVSPILALGEFPEDPNRGWPDALAASVLAARQTVPILLTQPSALPADTRALLEGDGLGEVRIVGGTGAISQQVEDEVRGTGHATRRLAGENRYQTGLAIAEETMRAGAGLANVVIATGRNYPDALGAGTPVARMGSVLLLVDGQSPTDAVMVYGWLRNHAAEIDRITVLGGQAAIGYPVVHRVTMHANWPR